MLRPVTSLQACTQAGLGYDAAIVYVDPDGAGTVASRRRSILDALSQSVVSGGRLVLAVPQVGERFQPDGPDGLPGGWDVLRHAAVVQTSAGPWVRQHPESQVRANELAMLVCLRTE